MTEAEHYQQQLEQQEARDELTAKVCDAVKRLPFNQKVGLVGEADGDTFTIVGWDVRQYKVIIQEI